MRSEAERLVRPLQEPMRDRGDAGRGGSCGGDGMGMQLNEVRESVWQVSTSSCGAQVLERARGQCEQRREHVTFLSNPTKDVKGQVGTVCAQAGQRPLRPDLAMPEVHGD